MSGSGPILRAGAHGALGAGMALALLAGACGQARQDAGEPRGAFPVAVAAVMAPARQTLAERSRLTITVRNTGRRPIPDVALTLYGGALSRGTPGDTLGEVTRQPGVAERLRPVWIIDRGPAGGETAYSSTWALGRLAPGHRAAFTWRLTAVAPGSHTLRYRVAAGLAGRARAVLAGGRPAAGSLTVTVDSRPRAASVSRSGRVRPAPPARF